MNITLKRRNSDNELWNNRDRVLRSRNLNRKIKYNINDKITFRILCHTNEINFKAIINIPKRYFKTELTIIELRKIEDILLYEDMVDIKQKIENKIDNISIVRNAIFEEFKKINGLFTFILLYPIQIEHNNLKVYLERTCNNCKHNIGIKFYTMDYGVYCNLVCMKYQLFLKNQDFDT